MDLHRHRAADAAAVCRTHASLPVLSCLDASARRRPRRPRRPLWARPAFAAWRLMSGASRARTGDLLAASQTLSQLSYGPARPKCSGEFEIFGPVNAGRGLVVSMLSN